MKSHLLSVQDLNGSDEFKKDVKMLCGFNSAIMQQLPDVALEALEAPTEAEAQNVRIAAAERLAIPLAQFEHGLSVPAYLLRQFAPNGDAEKDQSSGILDDLTELELVPEDKRDDVLHLLEKTKGLAQDKVQMILLRKAHYQTALPVLGSVSTVVDFRAIFNEAYKYEKDVAQFKPKFMGTVPLGIVEMRLKGAHSKEIFFQVNKRSLQVLVDTLVALQKQIDIAEKDIKSI